MPSEPDAGVSLTHRAIAAVEGVDALLIGCADLCME